MRPHRHGHAEEAAEVSTVGEVACGKHDVRVGGEKGDTELTEAVQAPGARERHPFSGQSASTAADNWSRLSCRWCSVRPALTLLFSSLIQITADPKFTPCESNFDPALNQQTNSFNLSYLSHLILKEQGRNLSEIWAVFFEEHMMYGFDNEHEVAGTVVSWGDMGAQRGHRSCEELWPQSAQHRRIDQFHGELKQRAASGAKSTRE
jgi:hypothetical protein